MNERELTMGRFRTDVVGGPAVETDCSSWIDPNDGEWTFGRFVTDVVSGPAILRPTSKPSIQLSFSVEDSSQFDTVLAKVGHIIELIKGCGFSWDRANLTGESGRIAIQFVPTTEDAVERLPWLKETLTPVLADIREVSKPEWNDIPASKV